LQVISDNFGISDSVGVIVVAGFSHSAIREPVLLRTLNSFSSASLCSFLSVVGESTAGGVDDGVIEEDDDDGVEEDGDDEELVDFGGSTTTILLQQLEQNCAESFKALPHF